MNHKERSGTMTSTDLIPMPLNYLDKALTKLRDLGLMPEKPDETPVVAMIQKISLSELERLQRDSVSPDSLNPNWLGIIIVHRLRPYSYNSAGLSCG